MAGEEDKNENRDAYRKAFDEVWAERSKGHANCSVESTVKGPLKMADTLLDVYFKEQ
ncbi:MAG: hypothetical protein LBQ76_06880 [Candidatus Fibromonas sp.]|jgi:hypothetical protein|nr:hypothetical protein [Candidatus Fibromonas sp.]